MGKASAFIHNYLTNTSNPKGEIEALARIRGCTYDAMCTIIYRDLPSLIRKEYESVEDAAIHEWERYRKAHTAVIGTYTQLNAYAVLKEIRQIANRNYMTYEELYPEVYKIAPESLKLVCWCR